MGRLYAAGPQQIAGKDFKRHWHRQVAAMDISSKGPAASDAVRGLSSGAAGTTALRDADQQLDRPAPARRRRRSRGDDLAAQHYRAIIESSEDAIVSKDLDGVILSWNQGAERLFGFTSEEAVGRSITIIIPSDRLDEESAILEKIHRGERIDHFETIRQHKDGSRVDISLTISPIRNSRGKIVGASKIARDITELRKARDRQQLLMREMSHRVRNLFTLCGSIVGLSARSARSPQELAEMARARLSALARAHVLTFSRGFEEHVDRPTTLQSLVRTIVAPFNEPEAPRITLSGIDAGVSGSSAINLALLLHEFATNAAKYGALSSARGTVKVVLAEEGDAVVVYWTERGGPPVDATKAKAGEGFGAVLSRIAVSNQLGAELVRDWRREGLAIRLSVPRSRLTA
jgi:PAS domain S-box-containing protein